MKTEQELENAIQKWESVGVELLEKNPGKQEVWSLGSGTLPYVHNDVTILSFDEHSGWGEVGPIVACFIDPIDALLYLCYVYGPISYQSLAEDIGVESLEELQEEVEEEILCWIENGEVEFSSFRKLVDSFNIRHDIAAYGSIEDFCPDVYDFIAPENLQIEIFMDEDDDDDEDLLDPENRVLVANFCSFYDSYSAGGFIHFYAL